MISAHEETHFLVASYWRGALNIGSIRTFSDFQQALQYYKGVSIRHTNKRLYRVKNKRPPVMINTAQWCKGEGDLYGKL